jgi:tetratricopeptide (TPR) repeat protein
LEVRENGETRAQFEILPAYTAVDLAAMAEAAADPARRADLYQKAYGLDSSSTLLREKLVEALVGAERKVQAAEMLEEDAEKAPQNREILNRLLGLYTEIGDNEKSIGALTRLIVAARTAGADHAAWQIQLAELYLKMQRPDSAATVYEEMFAEATDDAAKIKVLESLRALHRETGAAEQEIAVIKRLLDIAPENRAPGLWADIIALYEKLGDAEPQAAAWLTLAELLPEGENKANAYKRAAYLLARTEKLTEAAAAFEAALALDPGDINVHLNLGRLASAQNNREAYRAQLNKALEIAPDRDDLRRELAQALADDALKTEAEAEYDKLLAQNPDDLDSRLRLIAILEESVGKEEKLRAEYAKLMAAQADNRVAAYNLAVLNFRAEKWDEAITALKKVLELEPNDLDARSYLFSAYEKKGERENMLSEALEIYRRDRERRDFRELLVNSYENAADWPKLAALAEEFTRLNARDVEAWRLLSRTLARQNKPVESAGALFSAAQAIADDKDLWQSAAEAMSVQNQLPEAKQAYEKLLELDPTNKRAAEGLLDISLRQVSRQ